jgi:hypothetical protein
MKSLGAVLIILWFTLVIELTWRAVLPQGALLIPVVCTMLCWLRTPLSFLSTGSLLLLDWIARPGSLPLAPLLLPLAASAVLIPPASEAVTGENGFWRIPGPLLVPLLSVFGGLLQAAGTVSLRTPDSAVAAGQQLLGSLQPLLLVVLPVSGAGALLIRCADELGLRRSFGFPS